jgi:superfamily II DNA or RNA helicase
MLIHQPTKSIVLKLRDPSRVLTFFPRLSRMIDANEGNVQIKHTLETTLRLNELGFNAPSPIFYQYNWPGKYTPYEHQRPMADFHIRNSKGLNLSEMGVGKSFSTLWAADYLMSLGEVKRALILAPLSILETIWQQDIFDVLMHRSSVVTHGDREYRLNAFGMDVDFYIANHDMIAHKEIATLVRKRKDIDLIILDEASFFRNSRNISYKFFAWATEHKKRVWLLTGTPCPNAPTDAWALAKLVCPERVPKFFGAFQRMTMKQVSQYKWRPVNGHAKIVFDALQPAIRFRKSECLDLPPVVIENRQTQLTLDQQKAYRLMRDHMILQHKTEKITAVNAADALIKLRQICCIAAGTPVLTRRGWVPIQHVALTDQLWDGVEWVSHGGVIDKGRRDVIMSDGVSLTSDHEVLCVKSGNRFNRAPVRLPHRSEACWYDDGVIPKSDMAMSLRLRPQGHTRKPEFARIQTSECQTLWVPAWRAHRHPWNEQLKTLPHLDTHAPTMYRSNLQRLQKLRRAWNRDMRQMVEIIRGFLGGNVGRLCADTVNRTDRQQWSVLQSELSLGNSERTRQQHSRQSPHQDTPWVDDYRSGRDNVQYPEAQSLLQNQRRMAYSQSAELKVYDILNCGSRSRFVVRGAHGELMIVHNCGSIKKEDDTYETIDHSIRLRELISVINQAAAKAVVVVPFKGITRALETELASHFSLAVLNGDVSIGERNRIIRNFKSRPDPRVLLCHPAVMSHGLNLTEADTTIFYAPIYSHDQYAQVIERFNRAGQTRKMTVVRIFANAFEQEIYNLLDNRALNQDNILRLYERVITS